MACRLLLSAKSMVAVETHIVRIMFLICMFTFGDQFKILPRPPSLDLFFDRSRSIRQVSNDLFDHIALIV